MIAQGGEAQKDTRTSYAASVIRGTYFPYVDGIRALAVLAVLLFHLSAAFCPGGFTGVDVFFVISGYLIGGGIIRDLRSGTFSMKDFYTRRIKRIMPAYFTVIVTMLVVGIIFYHYELLSSLGNASLRSSYFFANFFCYKFLGNYFAGDGTTHPLMNLWSLSVEEQFYIVIPLLLLLLWKWQRRLVLPTILLLMVLSLWNADSLLFSETERNHIKAFYLAQTRAWELLGGVAIAWFPRFNADSRGKRIGASLASTAGFLLVLAGYICLSSGSFFPGHGALASIIGTCLIIHYGAYGPVNRVLSWGPVVGIGRISYSLYLWHWPIIAFLHYYCGGALGWPQMLLAVVLSFLLATLSWRFVEMPVRRCKTITFCKAMAGLLITCVVVGGTGAVLQNTKGLVHVLHPRANRYASLDFPPRLQKWEQGKYGISQLNLNDEKGRVVSNVIERLGVEDSQPDFLIVGDSHAEAFKGGLNRVCLKNGKAGLAVGMKTCPLTGMNITNTFSNAVEPVVAWLEKAPGINTVLIVCRWDTRLSSTSSNQVIYRCGESIPADCSNNSAYLEEGLLNTCRRIKALGKDVVLVGPVPILKISPGSEIRRRAMLGLPLESAGDAITVEEFHAYEQPVIDILKRVSAATGARLVFVHPVLEQDGTFRGLRGEMLLYHDKDHLSADGAEYVVNGVFNALFPNPKF